MGQAHFGSVLSFSLRLSSVLSVDAHLIIVTVPAEPPAPLPLKLEGADGRVPFGQFLIHKYASPYS